jgi:hypothetical protein
MSNVFSSEFWRALYFRAMGGQASAADPNAMSGSFAGSASFTGLLEAEGAPQQVDLVDKHDGRKRQPEYDQDTLIALARAEDEADKARREKERKSKFDLRRILGRVLGEPEPLPPKPIAPPVTIVPAPEPEPSTAEADKAAALALRQKEDDDAIILLLLAA